MVRFAHSDQSPSAAPSMSNGVDKAAERFASSARTALYVKQRREEKQLWSEQLNESLQHAATPASAFMGSFMGLGGLSLAQTMVPPDNREHLVVFAASFGALSTLLYAAPAAPLGKPRNAFLGHILAVSTALAIHYGDVFLRAHVGGWAGIPASLERVLTPALAIALMVLFKTPHPPAAAIVAYYSTLPEGLRGAMFMLFPALFGVVYFFLVQFVVATCLRWLGDLKQKLCSPLQSKSKGQLLV